MYPSFFSNKTTFIASYPTLVFVIRRASTAGNRMPKMKPVIHHGIDACPYRFLRPKTPASSIDRDVDARDETRTATFFRPRFRPANPKYESESPTYWSDPCVREGIATALSHADYDPSQAAYSPSPRFISYRTDPSPFQPLIRPVIPPSRPLEFRPAAAAKMGRMAQMSRIQEQKLQPTAAP